MGNRAIIAFTHVDPGTGNARGVHENAVYVHWNGGAESVYAVLDVAREIGQLNAVGVAMLYRLFFGLENELSVYPHPWTGFESAVITADDNGVYLVPRNVRPGDSLVASRRTMKRLPDGARAFPESQEWANDEALLARLHPEYQQIRAHLQRLVGALQREAAAAKAESGEKVPA